MIPFIEKRLNDLSPKQSDEKLPQAAVLILITDNENDYSNVFTERSKKVPSHAGEVAFPGGKKEEEDKNLIETVLRETHEEIGVEPNSIRILGRMDPQESRFGISVTPYVGYAAGSLKFKKDPKAIPPKPRVQSFIKCLLVLNLALVFLNSLFSLLKLSMG